MLLVVAAPLCTDMPGVMTVMSPGKGSSSERLLDDLLDVKEPATDDTSEVDVFLK